MRQLMFIGLVFLLAGCNTPTVAPLGNTPAAPAASSAIPATVTPIAAAGSLTVTPTALVITATRATITPTRDGALATSAATPAAVSVPNDAPPAPEITVPPGFRTYVYFRGLQSPTSLAFGPDSRLYIAEQSGRVLSVADQNGRGVSPRDAATVGSGLLGIAFRPGTRDLYFSTTGRVLLSHGASDGAYSEPKIIVNSIPTGRHQNDEIAFTADGSFFFLGVGSTCDVCQESHPWSASIVRFSADGTQQEVFAKGTRNPFGLAIHPQTGELFATDNGRDVPGTGVPDELNVIIKGGNYGWPDCWGNGKGSNCQGTLAPVVELQEHSSADGLAFYTGTRFPAEYRGNVFIAMWGGNVPVPTVGKRLERVVLSQANGKWTGQVSTFASGFSHPLAVAVGPNDGALYIADHGNGTIYRIAYAGK